MKSGFVNYINLVVSKDVVNIFTHFEYVRSNKPFLFISRWIKTIHLFLASILAFTKFTNLPIKCDIGDSNGLYVGRKSGANRQKAGHLHTHVVLILDKTNLGLLGVDRVWATGIWVCDPEHALKFQYLLTQR